MAGYATRTYWVLCVVFGAGVIAFAVWLVSIIPTQACGGNLPWGTSPFLAYQLSRTTADIEAVFGQEEDRCRRRMVAALDFANKIDLVAFILIYSGFVACFFLAMRRDGYAALARIGLIATVATLGFDVLETSAQLRITGSLPGPVESLVLLTISSAGKFLGLTVAGMCAGAAMLARSGISRLAGVVCVAGAFMVALGLNYLPARPALPLGLGIIFVMMLLYAAVATMRTPPSTTTTRTR